MEVVDPRDFNWSEADDLIVKHAAKSGIREAILEARRRGLL